MRKPAFALSVAYRFRLRARRFGGQVGAAGLALSLAAACTDPGGKLALFRQDGAARRAAHALHFGLRARVAGPTGLVRPAGGASPHRLVRRPHGIPPGNRTTDSRACGALGTEFRQFRIHIPSSRREMVERRPDYRAGFRLLAAARSRARVCRAHRLPRVLHQGRAGLQRRQGKSRRRRRRRPSTIAPSSTRSRSPCPSSRVSSRINFSGRSRARPSRPTARPGRSRSTSSPAARSR